MAQSLSAAVSLPASSGCLGTLSVGKVKKCTFSIISPGTFLRAPIHNNPVLRRDSRISRSGRLRQNGRELLQSTSALTGDFSAVLEQTAWNVSLQDLGMMVFTLGGASLWVGIFNELAQRNVLEQKLSRKLVHISTGLLLLLLWPFFSTSPTARFLAVVPCIANMFRIVAVGTGAIKNESMVKSVSREGDPKELLRGPLYYVLVLVAVTLLFWRESAVGIVALSMMCAGDGVADIIGRRYGTSRLPYNPGKSWAGSLAMFSFGFAVSLALVAYFCDLGFFTCHLVDTTWRVAVIALLCTIVESLPITTKLDDNFSVPVTAIGSGVLLFHM